RDYDAFPSGLRDRPKAPLRIYEVALDLFPRGHIVGHDQYDRASVGLERVGCDVDIQDDAVLALVAPFAHLLERSRLGLEIVVELPEASCRTDVGDGHRQELLARVTVRPLGSIVDIEEAKRRRIVDPHRYRAVRKQ